MTHRTQSLKGFFLALSLSLALAGAGPAFAAQGALMTGNTLAVLCTSDKQDSLFACQSYIAGIIDYHHLIKGLGTAPSVDFCLPAGIKMAQIKDVVTAYIIRHTEHQDFVASPGVTMALFNAWPCKGARWR